MEEPSEEPPPGLNFRDEGDDEDNVDPEKLQQLKRCAPRWLHLLEAVIGPVIIANLAFVCYETDLKTLEDDLSQVPQWLSLVNRGFLAFYTVELFIHVYVERMSFHKSYWNIFDAFIVASGLSGEVVSLFSSDLDEGFSGSQVGVLRTFRVLRMLRVVRLLSAYKELWLLVRNLLSAMRTLFWSAVLFAIMLTIWSILAVEYIHPVMSEVTRDECRFCAVAFSSVLRADFTFFQIMSGDDWGVLANEVIDEHPWTALVFVPMVVTMVFGMINLISAVMVENAAQARLDDHAAVAKEQAKRMRRAKTELEAIFLQLDSRGSGELTLDEIYKGSKTNEQFKNVLNVLHVKPQELKYLFAILDEDSSGTVTATEFADRLYYMKTQETRTTLMFLWHNVSDLSRKQEEHLSLLRSVLRSQQESNAVLRESAAGKAVSCASSTPGFRKSVSFSDEDADLCGRAGSGLASNIDPAPELSPTSPKPYLRKSASLSSLRSTEANGQPRLRKSVSWGAAEFDQPDVDDDPLARLTSGGSADSTAQEDTDATADSGGGEWAPDLFAVDDPAMHVHGRPR